MPTGTQVINTIPPGAQCIIRSAQAATSPLYTVGTGRRLHVVSVWFSEQGAAVTGSLQMTADVENDANREVLSLVVPAVALGAGWNSIAIAGIDVPVAAAGTVNLTVTSVSGGSFKGGFIGWEESVTK